MKKVSALLFITALCFLFPLFSKAFSCGDLMGRIIDVDTHLPVAHAEVIFENYYYKLTVVANQYGYYNASYLPEGRYQMRVVYNCHTFTMKRVRVYDGYANEVNFFVSGNDGLPQLITEATPDPVIKIFQQNNDVITSTGTGQASVPFSDILMELPGVDIYEGHLYIKGYARGDEAKIFVDGTPVLAPAHFNK